jgi:hypothetical protein
MTHDEKKAAAIIESKILNYMEKSGGAPAEWYVGIAAHPQRRLFDDHQVREENDAWICLDAKNHTIARYVEAHLTVNLGTAGGPGGGDEASSFVYAYRKTPRTRE